MGWLDKYQNGEQPKILQNFEQYRNSPEGKFQFENMERNRIAKKSSGRIDYAEIDPITDIALPMGIAKATGLFRGAGKNLTKDTFSSIHTSPTQAPVGYSNSAGSALRRDLIQPVNLREANERIRAEMLRKSETDPYIREYLRQNSIFGFGKDKALNNLVNVPDPKVVRSVESLSDNPELYNTLAYTRHGEDIRLNSKYIAEQFTDPLQAEKEILGHELHHNLHPSTIKSVYGRVDNIPINDYMERMNYPQPVINQVVRPQELLARTSEVKNKFGFKLRPDGSIKDNAGYNQLTPHHFEFVRNNPDLFNVTESGVPQAMRSIDLSKVNINKYATGLSGAAALNQAIPEKEFRNGGSLQEYQPNFNDSSVSIPQGFVGQGNTIPNWKSPAWGGRWENGGTLPGNVGFQYARHGAPSEGKYAKKTLPSAKNGDKLTYQLWEEVTGTPWKTAKKLGLTSGSYDDNIKIRNRLINEGNFLADTKREVVDNAPIARADRLVDMRTNPQNILMQAREAQFPQYGDNQLASLPEYELPNYRDTSSIDQLSPRSYNLLNIENSGLAPLPQRRFENIPELSAKGLQFDLPIEQPTELPYRPPYEVIPKMQNISGNIDYRLPQGLSPIPSREPYQAINQMVSEQSQLPIPEHALMPVLPHKVTPVTPTSPNKPSTKELVIQQKPHSISDFKTVKTAKDIIESSNLPDDVKQVVMSKIDNKKFQTFGGKYYVLSKDSNNIYAFDKNHKLIDSTVAGRGKQPGDFPNRADVNTKTPGSHATTRTGSGVINEITYTDYDKQHFGTPFNRIKFNDVWKDSEGLGLHGIYKDEFEFRKAVMDNPKIIDKLLSWGCINIDPKWLTDKYTKPAVGDSIFITREPLRNLNLLAQTKRSYRNGGELTKLDQLTNFTNYNTKQPGGWLDKYQ